jgi:hypothetical protein
LHRALPARRHDASLRLDDRDFRQQRQDNRAHYRGGQFHSALMRIFLSILSACGMTLRSVPPTQKRGSMGGGSDNNDDNAGGRSIGRAIGIAIPAVIGPPGRWAPAIVPSGTHNCSHHCQRRKSPSSYVKRPIQQSRSLTSLRRCESPGNPARIAALSTDRTLTAIIGCPHHHIGQEYAIFEPA